VPTNSTLLRVIGALVGAALLSLPLYLAYATAVGADSGGYSSQYYKRKRKRAAEGLEEEGTREQMKNNQYKLHTLDFASYYFYLLLESLKRHEKESLASDSVRAVACLAGKRSASREDEREDLIGDFRKILR